MKTQAKHFKISFNIILFFIWLVLFTGIGIANPQFFAFDYSVGVMLRSAVEIGLVALPMTLVIITGGIDLSVGNTMVLAAMLGGLAAIKYGNFAGFLATILIGFFCGLLNGLIIAKVKVSPMITTLSTMFLYLGLARGITSGDSVYAYDIAFFFGDTSIAGIPAQIFLYAVLAVVFWVILAKSVYGRKLYAIGLNENAARYAGINVDRVKTAAYVLTGLVSSLAALIWLGRFNSLKYDAGTNFNLKVITIVVLGGTSITGGYGDMRGTILATLIIATLTNGLTVLNIPIGAQTIVQGVVLIISLISLAIVNQRKNRKKIIKVEAPATH